MLTLALWWLASAGIFPPGLLGRCKQGIAGDSFAGRLDAGPDKDTQYFYWLFKSLTKDAPLILWLNGGPGCSSGIGAFTEMGPCRLDPASTNPQPNPHSWTRFAHMLFVDQPAGVGFSTGKWRKSKKDDGQRAEDVGAGMAAFLDNFFITHPELKETPFYVFGESYAGHYVPAIAKAWVQRDRPLAGIGIGNGLTSASAEYWGYVKFLESDGGAKQGGSYKGGPLQEASEVKKSRAALPCCLELLKQCDSFTNGEKLKRGKQGIAIPKECAAKKIGKDLRDGIEPDMGACARADDFCDWAIENIPTDVDYYDVRRKRCAQVEEDHRRLGDNDHRDDSGGILHSRGTRPKPPPGFAPAVLPCRQNDNYQLQRYLNRPDVQLALGLPVNSKWKPGRHWAECNEAVDGRFAGDRAVDYTPIISDLLEGGVRVMLYAGDTDYICNWLGIKKWAEELEWAGKDEFAAAEDKAWVVDGKPAGRWRTAQNFEFVQVYDAGHMVPEDQPEAALDMLDRFLHPDRASPMTLSVGTVGASWALGVGAAVAAALVAAVAMRAVRRRTDARARPAVELASLEPQ